MRKNRLLPAVVSVCVLLAAVLVACPNPANISTKGALAVSITDSVNARTLLPDYDMDVASFLVLGDGPGEASFSTPTSGGTLTIDELTFGTWSITVNALNAGGATIGSGQATVAVHTGATTAVDITVVPLSGNGTLSVTVSWPDSQVEHASILASLTPPSGPDLAMSFSASGNHADWSSTTVPAGYQTLTLQLLDTGIPVMGAVEVVRIVAGQTTRGTYVFTGVNAPGGTVQVHITPQMAEPIPVTISGVPAALPAGSALTATASVTDGTTGVVYVWYLNGASVATGQGCTLGSTLRAGWYRLDVTAFGPGGTRGGSATTSFRVTAAGGSGGPYVYVTNEQSANLSAYAVGADGLLAPVSTAGIPDTVFPFGITASPDGSVVYMVNSGADNSLISLYAVGAGGVLSPSSPATVPVNPGPDNVALTPNGAFLYVTSEVSQSVSEFIVGPGGALTPLGIVTTADGMRPYGIAITPDGRFLYATDAFVHKVRGWSIGPDGRLTALGTPSFATGQSPMKIAITPDGRYLYVTNDNSMNVSGYSIGPDGLLTPMNPPTFPAGSGPLGIVASPDGRFLYVTNSGGGSGCSYAIGAGGTLTPLVSGFFVTGVFPAGIAITPDGRYLYVASVSGNWVAGFSIGADGHVSPLSTPTFPAGTAPFGIVVVP